MSDSLGKDTTFSRKQELVLFNPFTIHNNSPKWPDGLAGHSMGVKHQRTTEIHGEETILVLFPGMLNWLMCYSHMNETADPPDVTEGEVFASSSLLWQLTACHGLTHETDNLLQFKLTTSQQAHFMLNEEKDKVVEWRPVSIGLRLYCANNDRQNDGWIECCRVPHSYLTECFGLHANKYDDTDTQLSPYSTEELLVPWQKVRIGNGFLNMSNSWITRLTRCADANSLTAFRLSHLPGYATLPLKDVADYQFCLNPNKQYNEFNTVRNFHYNTTSVKEEYGGKTKYVDKVDSATNYGYKWITNTFNFRRYVPVQKMDAAPHQLGGRDEVFFGQDFSADSHDCIILKIHGNKDTRLVLHTAANYEYLTTNNVDTGVTVAYSDPYLIKKYIDNRCTFHKLPFDSKSLYPDTKY